MFVGEYYKFFNTNIIDYKDIHYLYNDSPLYKYVDTCNKLLLSLGYTFSKGLWYIYNDGCGNYKLYMNSACFGTISVSGFVDKEFRDLVFELNGNYPNWRYFTFKSEVDISWYSPCRLNCIICDGNDFDVLEASRSNISIFLKENNKEVDIYSIVNSEYLLHFLRIIYKFCNNNILDGKLSEEDYMFGVYKTVHMTWYRRIIKIKGNNVEYILYIYF